MRQHLVDVNKEWDDGSLDLVDIAVLLTEKCNFRCEHCMFSCTPEGSAEYMSNETLYAIWDEIKKLDGHRFNLNIAGGEPTLNLTEFERCLDVIESIASDTGCMVFISTNGWWLKKKSTARRFFKIISRMSFWGSEDFCIRISNDRWHDEFRDYDPEELLEEYMTYNFIEEKAYCGECEHEGDDCPEHGWDHIEYDYDESDCVCFNQEEKDWIYVETPASYTHFTPNGRGKNVGTNADCNSDVKLLFDVHGNLKDICCRGSVFNMGHITDGLLPLLAIGRDFKKKKKPDCWNCEELIDEWREETKVVEFLMEDHEVVDKPNVLC